MWHITHQRKDWEQIRSNIPYKTATEDTANEVYQNGEAGLSFEGLRLDGADFQNISDQSGAFYRCSLIGTRFGNADLTVYSFRRDADLRGADFSKANLDCRFDGADLRGSCFDSAKLDSYTSFKNSDLRRTTFKDTELPPAEQFEEAIVEEGAEWLNDSIEEVVTILSLGMGVEWTYEKTKDLKDRIQEKQEKEDDSESTGEFVFGVHSERESNDEIP